MTATASQEHIGPPAERAADDLAANVRPREAAPLADGCNGSEGQDRAEAVADDNDDEASSDVDEERRDAPNRHVKRWQLTWETMRSAEVAVIAGVFLLPFVLVDVANRRPGTTKSNWLQTLCDACASIRAAITAPRD